MTQQEFNHDQYREISKKQWEQTAADWHKWAPVLRKFSEPATTKMLELARITTGSHVLDIAAGDGRHSINAANLVGKSGYVLVTDMAENMVSFAREAAREAALTQMEARVMDGENLTVDDQSFDAVICQFALMLFANPSQGLSEAYRVLKPGGYYAAAVFTTPDKTPWLAIPAKIALERAGRPMPSPGTPGLFALGDEDRLKNLMSEVGFTDIDTHTMTWPMQLESAAECAKFVREVAGAVTAILMNLDENEQQAAWEAIEQGLSVFEGDNGFSAPSEIRVIAGKK